MTTKERPTADGEETRHLVDGEPVYSNEKTRGESSGGMLRSISIKSVVLFSLIAIFVFFLASTGIPSLLFRKQEQEDEGKRPSSYQVADEEYADDELSLLDNAVPSPSLDELDDDDDGKDASVQTKPATSSPTFSTKKGGGGKKASSRKSKQSKEEADGKEDEERQKKALREEKEMVRMFEEEEALMDKDSGIDTGDDDNQEDESSSSSSNTSSDTEQLKLLIEDDDDDDDQDEDDDSDNNADYVPAPRTTVVEYNEMDKSHRYLLYNPSGGMTNQELELLNALPMAQAMNRTLYVPMIGRHSNIVTGYNALRMNDLFVADRLFDFEWLGKYVRVVPLNMTLKKFLARVAKLEGQQNIRYVQTDAAIDGAAVTWNLRNVQNRLVFVSGNGMWSRWWEPQVRNKARRYISYSPYLRNLAMEIADKTLGPQFYAIHGRLGDELYLWDGKDSGSAFVRTPTFQKWNKSLSLYLASDEPQHGFFRDLKNRINVIIANDLKGPEVDRFRNLFPNSRVMKDMFGVLDKLICTMGIGFMGSPFSTFSRSIHIMRTSAKFVFPELYARRFHLSPSLNVTAIRLMPRVEKAEAFNNNKNRGGGAGEQQDSGDDDDDSDG